MTDHPLSIERLHSSDGDYDDLGWYSKGHHDEARFRSRLAAMLAEHRHPSEADETRCHFVHAWWRNVPTADGMRLQTAAPKSRGAYPVTAMLTPEAEF